MVMDEVKKYIPDKNAFYRDNYHYFLYGLSIIMLLVLIMISIVLYQLYSRPLPAFSAKAPNGSVMRLTAATEPNQLPETIIRFASQAVIGAYTLRFDSVNDQVNSVRPYFTDAGWVSFQASIASLVKSVVANRLTVNGVVVGTPVISNQGRLPGLGFSWRVQIPLLVSYQTESKVSRRKYMVAVTIVKVPTGINPQGIGIEQLLTA